LSYKEALVAVGGNEAADAGPAGHFAHVDSLGRSTSKGAAVTAPLPEGRAGAEGRRRAVGVAHVRVERRDSASDQVFRWNYVDATVAELLACLDIDAATTVWLGSGDEASDWVPLNPRQLLADISLLDGMVLSVQQPGGEGAALATRLLITAGPRTGQAIVVAREGPVAFGATTVQRLTGREDGGHAQHEAIQLEESGQSAVLRLDASVRLGQNEFRADFSSTGHDRHTLAHPSASAGRVYFNRPPRSRDDRSAVDLDEEREPDRPFPRKVMLCCAGSGAAISVGALALGLAATDVATWWVVTFAALLGAIPLILGTVWAITTWSSGDIRTWYASDQALRRRTGKEIEPPKAPNAKPVQPSVATMAGSILLPLGSGVAMFAFNQSPYSLVFVGVAVIGFPLTRVLTRYANEKSRRREKAQYEAELDAFGLLLERFGDAFRIDLETQFPDTMEAASPDCSLGQGSGGVSAAGGCWGWVVGGWAC
jgi:hypothetical protein